MADLASPDWKTTRFASEKKRERRSGKALQFPLYVYIYIEGEGERERERERERENPREVTRWAWAARRISPKYPHLGLLATTSHSGYSVWNLRPRYFGTLTFGAGWEI